MVYFSNNKEKFGILINYLKCKIRYLIYIFGICIVILLVIFFGKSNLEIHFLDVGQGDCSLIITPSKKTILIDGGNNEGYDNGENVIMPYLLKNGITAIDYVIVSHR